ncbi:Stress response protein NST1 [Talaromyces islandicus]|uniref:Stress response protein NST1 n=1 Tax=Talaromyces islandicus TaxID=28573 RepID=A0A0U1M4X9_TALIS|nr:Stress response protein NST1 [Talaromyces islandicus]
MARRYEIEELLWLRNSPLVTKPDKLPPIEEWMGPIPDPTTRKPTNPRDQTQNDNQNRRPNLFEPRHISRNSNSEDIVLGPPKTAFSSATRLFGGRGSIDATDRTSRLNDSDEAKTDRFNFKDKFPKDRDDLDRRDNKFGSLQGRRNEREDWNAGRPRRTFNQDDQDPKFRRNGDATTRWDGKERPDESGFNRKDKDGRFVKRDAQPRGRHEQSWFRDEIAPDAGELEEEKPYMRNREWRRGERQAPDRDWNNRNPRFEQDPEWMDSTGRDEPKQAHTQEDFQRWKEKMKAGSAAPQSQFEEKAEAPPEQHIREHHKAEPSHLDGELFAANQAPIGGLDNFFKLLREPKQSPQEVSPVAPADTLKKDSVSGKASKSSRFAGLFSPPPDSPNKQQPEPVVEQSRPDRPVSTDADQEGFQRILQMLGGSKSRNATPQLDSSQTSRPPSYSQPDQSRPTPPPPPGLSSPSRDALNRQHEFMNPQDGVAPRAVMPPPGMGSMIPRDPQAQFRDRDNLLRLMQQVKVSPNTPGQHANASMSSPGGHTPGILNVPDLLSRPQGMQKTPRNQPFLDDPAIANMQRPDVDLHDQPRRPVNGPPMGYFDDMVFPGGPQGGRGSAVQGGRTQGHPPPMGIPRPPGFEQMPPPPPGWTGQMPPQQGSGLHTPNRGINPNFLNGPVPMHGANMPPGPPPPPPSESSPFMRGMSGGNGAGNTFGPPPGMMPPPGYMNVNGPPPPPAGFPPMPHNPEAMMNMGAGSSGPPPSSRHLLDMFAQGNGGGGDGRGAMLGGGPPFR